MANEPELRVWPFIVGALRIILFIICILALFVTIFILWFLTQFDYSIISDTQTIYIYIFHVELIYLLFVASVGLFGAYSGNPEYLELFSQLIFIHGVLFFLVSAIYLVATDRNTEMAKFSEHMEDYAKRYQFDLSPYEEPDKATKAWDLLQGTFGCCGVRSKYDWLDWRSGLTSMSLRLPKSCCVNLPRSIRGLCTTSSPYIHEDGCGQIYAELFPTSLFSSTIELLVNIILAKITLLMAKDIVRRQSKCQKLPASV